MTVNNGVLVINGTEVFVFNAGLLSVSHYLSHCPIVPLSHYLSHCYNFEVEKHFCSKFGTMMENRQPKGSPCSKIGFSKIQDGGRPPFWFSILDHNFGVDQHFCIKFGTVIENRQPKGSPRAQKPGFQKCKMACWRSCFICL